MAGRLAYGPEIIVLTGEPGLGTTTLALRHAWSARPRYPGGISYVDLKTTDDTLLAGHPHNARLPPMLGDQPGPATELDTFLIIDGAVSVRQVMPFLVELHPEIVVTSSQSLQDLPGARVIRLDHASPTESVNLLRTLIRATKVAPSDPALTSISAACAGNVLALAVVAANIRSGHYADLTAAARALNTSLVEVTSELRCGEMSVVSSFGYAISACTPAERRTLTAIADFSGRRFQFADAVSATSQDGAKLRLSIRGLIDRNLVHRVRRSDVSQLWLSPLCAGTALLMKAGGP